MGLTCNPFQFQFQLCSLVALQMGERYPRLQLEGSKEMESDLDEFPLIGLETCCSAVYHQRKKKA